jgi:hypothetical protein
VSKRTGKTTRPRSFTHRRASNSEDAGPCHHQGYRKRSSPATAAQKWLPEAHRVDRASFALWCQPALELGDEGRERYSEDAAERPQLNDVEASLPAFAFADERLALGEPLGELHLRQTGSLAEAPEGFHEDAVVAGEGGFLHRPFLFREGGDAIVWNRIVQNGLV